jgi:hypothetical protein
MDFKIVSKNNMGCATTLLLVILLSQTKLFNFFIDTALGRTLLILFILFISYTNKILGVVSVLLIIILFNNSDIAYIEGFNNSQSTPTSITSTSVPVGSGPIVNDIKDKKIIQPSTQQPNDISTVVASSASTSHMATEGFDMASKERYIQKGHQSNQIAVNNYMKESENVAPYEGMAFTDSYSSF